LFMLPYSESAVEHRINGWYVVTNLVGNRYSSTVGYTLRPRVDDQMHQVSVSDGLVYFMPEGIHADILDENKSKA